MNTGTILHAEAAETPRHPASLTKMMTLYVLFGYLRAGKITPDSELVVTPHAASQAPTKLGLKPGAKIKVTDAAKALVTQSANDAAATIAENFGGTEENFARLMTETARRIGMTKTVFRNASGLPNDEQMTTARDMAILVRASDPRLPRILHRVRDALFHLQGPQVPQSQQASVRLQGHRRHQDRLYASKRLQPRRFGASRQQAPARGRARRQDREPDATPPPAPSSTSTSPKASETKPTDEQRVASFVGAPPPPLPAIKKPIFTLASMAPAPSPAASPAEGDIDPPRRQPCARASA